MAESRSTSSGSATAEEFTPALDRVTAVAGTTDGFELSQIDLELRPIRGMDLLVVPGLVVDRVHAEELHAARFDAICGWLREWFNVLPLDEAATRLEPQTHVAGDEALAVRHELVEALLEGRVPEAVVDQLREARLDLLDLARFEAGFDSDGRVKAARIEFL